MGRLKRHDAIVVSLLQWGASELRDLPWRRTNNPWHIFVSEVMLQQTNVDRVLPKYAAFIERFPTPHDLAQANLGEALTLWTGLGYPRRCRHLHEAARVIVTEHGGIVPSDLSQLLALPGVGQYTARAILCFAHRCVVGVVDTNISRVLSRLEGASMTTKQLQVLADSLVPVDSAWEWNQVLMDFGARHCTARTPQCEQCPVTVHCTWRGVGSDPAALSGGASKPQARFEGSNRQARGRAMKAVSGQPRTIDFIVAEMKLENDYARAETLINALVSEGLLVRHGDVVSLP